MKTTVIVTTYNRPDALAVVLEGYCGQSDQAFGLVVADDGSKEETAEVVRQFVRRAPFPLTHVWHEDRGFRAAAIHKQLAEPGYFLGSNRVLLSAGLTSRVLNQRLPIHAWRGVDWIQSWFRREVNRVLPLIQLPDGPFRKWTPDRWEGIKTCNFSAWRADLIRVNGLDESYEGWGLEDSDLVIRLLHAGVKHKSARFASTAFHLWHPEQDRMKLPANQKRLEDLLRSTTVRATIGLDQGGGL
jgi:glycosyltransferase involved in cell wall biosynthesis